MTLLLAFTLRIIPGIVVLGLVYGLLPKKEQLFKRLLLILGFILMRDAMTPIGLWTFGITDGVMWLRFIEDPFILISLGVFSLVIAFLLYRYVLSLKTSLKWFRGSTKIQAIIAGLVMPIIILGPFVIPYLFTPISTRGGAVPLSMLGSLFVFSLMGNFLEEILFRGYLQGYLSDQNVRLFKRILLSGLLFSMGHIFLAITVTNLGVLILIFTFWEGIICAALHEKYGIVSATLAHGISIFILASGLL